MSCRVVFLALSMVLGAGCGGEETRGPIPAGPAAVFEQMQVAMRAKDWNALYELFAPSERAEAERRWDAMRAEAKQTGSAHKARLDGFALEIQRPAAEVAAMDLRTFFGARNAAQAASNPGDFDRFVNTATIKSSKALEGDAVVLRIQVGDAEQEFPVKRERGRWHLWRTLAALTDF